MAQWHREFPFATVGAGRRITAARWRTVWQLLVLLWTTPLLAQVPCDHDGSLVSMHTIALQRVSLHAWRVPAARGDPDPSNGGLTTQLLVVRDGRRTWLIGSGPTPAHGAALACLIQRRLGRPVTDVVNSRAAPELAMGNVAFAGARLWALPDVIEAMHTRCEACRERLKARIGTVGESLHPDSVRVPSLPIGGPHQSRGRLGPVDWHALQRRHGDRTLVLRHRTDRLVIAQGLLWAHDLPDLRDTDSSVLLASLKALGSWSAGAMVVGEQGPPASRQAITAHIDYLNDLRAAVAARFLAGDERAAMGRSVDLPAYDAMPSQALRHPLNVQRVYREMEADLLR